MERDQYEWMLSILLETLKIHPPEDEMVNQYINVGLCKAAAVVGVVSMLVFSCDVCCSQKVLHLYV